MTGTKFGCDSRLRRLHHRPCGIATRSCIVPICIHRRATIVTIEAMAQDEVGRAVQQPDR